MISHIQPISLGMLRSASLIEKMAAQGLSMKDAAEKLRNIACKESLKETVMQAEGKL